MFREAAHDWEADNAEQMGVRLPVGRHVQRRVPRVILGKTTVNLLPKNLLSKDRTQTGCQASRRGGQLGHPGIDPDVRAKERLWQNWTEPMTFKRVRGRLTTHKGFNQVPKRTTHQQSTRDRPLHFLDNRREREDMKNMQADEKPRPEPSGAVASPPENSKHWQSFSWD